MSDQKPHGIWTDAGKDTPTPAPPAPDAPRR